MHGATDYFDMGFQLGQKLFWKLVILSSPTRNSKWSIRWFLATTSYCYTWVGISEQVWKKQKFMIIFELYKLKKKSNISIWQHPQSLVNISHIHPFTTSRSHTHTHTHTHAHAQTHTHTHTTHIHTHTYTHTYTHLKFTLCTPETAPSRSRGSRI